MTIKAIMNGEGYRGCVDDVLIAAEISKTAKSVNNTFSTDSKDNTGQALRCQCNKLHNAAIIWSSNQTRPWADKVEKLIFQAAEQIQSGNLTDAEKTFLQIRLHINGK